MLNTVPIFDDILYTNKRYKYYEKYCLYLIKVFQCCYLVPSTQQIILTTNIYCVGRNYFCIFFALIVRSKVTSVRAPSNPSRTCLSVSCIVSGLPPKYTSPGATN